MIVTDEAEVKQIDCARLSVAEIAQRLGEVDDGGEYRLENLSSGVAGLGAGLSSSGTFQIPVDVGDFPFMLGESSGMQFLRNVGDGCGHSMQSGSIIVRGSARDYLAAYATGGFVAVLGQTGKRCGYGLAGADVLVRSVVGDEAGFGMKDGILILGNGAGEGVGTGMTGGTLFVRGDVGSVSEGLKKIRMKEADSLRLSLLLARSGIKGNVKEFTIYRPRQAS